MFNYVACKNIPVHIYNILTDITSFWVTVAGNDRQLLMVSKKWLFSLIE
jgi:hypothetical protein